MPPARPPIPRSPHHDAELTSARLVLSANRIGKLGSIHECRLESDGSRPLKVKRMRRDHHDARRIEAEQTGGRQVDLRIWLVVPRQLR